MKKRFARTLLFLMIFALMLTGYASAHGTPGIIFNVREVSVFAGEPIHIDVSATEHLFGISRVSYQEWGGDWVDFDCNNAKECSHTFIVTKNEPGIYKFRGRVTDRLGSTTITGFDSVNVKVSEIACYKDLDCGENRWISIPFCSYNDVYQSYQTFMCNNPGTSDSYCSDKISNALKEDCREDSIEFSETYCKGNNIFRIKNTYDRGCKAGNCFQDAVAEEEFVEYCKEGCKDGACLPVTIKCHKDSDCGQDSYSEWSDDYCKGKDVYHSRTFFDKGCTEGECFAAETTQEELVEECSSACSDGECVQECTDGEKQLCPLQKGVCQGSFEVCTESQWLGCSAINYGSSYQKAETKCDGLDNDCDGLIDEGCAVRCNQNSDCGKDVWVDEPVCRDNEVFQTFRAFTCHNPGLHNSYCSFADELSLKQYCSPLKCEEGQCIEKEETPRKQILWVKLSIIEEEIKPGEDLRFVINLQNEDVYDIEDVKITATIPELGLRKRAGPFNLRRGNEITKTIVLYIPDYVKPGKYDARILVSEGGEVKRIKHREIKVV